MSAISPKYWPDALIPILSGSPLLSPAGFRACSTTLVEFRKKGNSPLSDELTDPEKLNAHIEEFYVGYRAISQVISVINAADAVYKEHFESSLVCLDAIPVRIRALSKMRFMQEISKFDKASLCADEKRYLKICGLPEAMRKISGGKELSSNRLAKKCIQAYYFAMTNSENIKENVRVYRGMSTKKMRTISAKKGKAEEWYRLYPQEVTIDMVVFLRKALDAVSRGRPSEQFVFNDIMQVSFHNYIGLAEELRLLDAKELAVDKNAETYSREEAYWASLQSDLKTFIDSAKKKKANSLRAKESKPKSNSV